jgi:UDP-N-acetylglucosamine--N-acetylmuramyl-(pentapeptide) pyrophosphoryl-undecaprenol N-acetylglucosamine transferase
MPKVTTTGTPVRPEFEPMDAAACRRAMGLVPDRPVMLIMGGSQGATGVNELIIHALPHLIRAYPDLQFIHLTGARDHDRVYTIYNAHRVKSVVRPFLSEMEYALGAATVGVSRAGASSLAEVAAMRLPTILIPYPTAADNHQFHNARAFVECGAARMLEQRTATAEDFIRLTGELLEHGELRRTMGGALSRFHFPNAAAHIADHMLATLRLRQPNAAAKAAAPKPAPSERNLNSQAIRSTPAPLK